MSECLTSSEMDRLLAGRLNDADRQRLESHVRACEDCRRAHDALCHSDESTRAAYVSAGDHAGSAPPGSRGDAVSDGRNNADVGLVGPIPGYQILQLIYQGGQGVVYLARQIATKRIVALKILRERGYVIESQLRRFEREVELVAGLKHPAIVTVYDSGIVNHQRYFSMEYIEGHSLSDYLRKASPGLRDRLHLFQRICDAVGFAHGQGIVHRDLKPSNVQVDEGGNPHILDFGLAKVAGTGTNPHAAPEVTLTGEFLGTLAYASPEQTTGVMRDVGFRSDVYSLGMMLYEALTGEKPYTLNGDIYEILRCIQRAEIKAPSTRCKDIDGELDAIVLKALSKEPERRYTTAKELTEDLNNYLSGRPIRARRDSVLYVLRKKTRSAAQRHIGAARVATALLASLFGYGLFRTGVFVRHSDRAFWSAAQRAAHVYEGKEWHDDVVVLALDDATFSELESLAAAESLEGVTHENVPSWRALHGALMRRLARAEPKVVAWDIMFQGAQPKFDGLFVEGMTALRLRGTRIILAEVATVGSARISTSLAAQADGTGCVRLPNAGGVVCGVAVAVTHPRLATLPSLSVRALAASRHPNMKPMFEWRRDSSRLIIQYVESPDSPVRDLSTVPAPDEITTEIVSNEWNAVNAFTGEEPNFRAACTLAIVPEPHILAKHTVSYKDVFHCSDLQLRRLFSKKIVLISDNRLTTASYPHGPDQRILDDGQGGRKEFCGYMHAAAICDFLNGIDSTLPRDYQYLAILCTLGFLGVWMGCRTTGNRRYAKIVVMGTVFPFLILAACYGVGAQSALLVAPTALVIAFWVSLVGSAWLARSAISTRFKWVPDAL